MKRRECHDARGAARRSIAGAAAIGLVFFLQGCETDTFVDRGHENQPPTVWLTSSPPEGDLTDYIVDLSWFADDPDGEVVYYEYVVLSGDPIGFDPADSTGPERWTRTTDCKVRLRMNADMLDTTIVFNEYPYGRFGRQHTFLLCAFYDRNGISETVYRSFTAFTLAPSVTITRPVNTNPASGSQYLPPIVRFGWEGKDPIDSPWNYQDVDSVRHMWTLFNLRLLDDLNGRPELFEDRWTPWIARDAPGDSGISTVIGDDEDIHLNKSYAFVVQAMDDAGAVTSVFDTKSNVRLFMIRPPTGPVVTLTVHYFGTWTFLGTANNPVSVNIPSGFPVKVTWEADAEQYGGLVAGYRYGWDIEDLSDPAEWACSFNPDLDRIPEKWFNTGVHTLFIEAIDNLGVSTIVQVDINVVTTVMDRNLLLVDDFMLSEQFTYYALPTESEHDEFWEGVCRLARGFDASRDVYDTHEHGFVPPSVEYLWRYKNVVWVSGTAREEFNTWKRVISVPSDGIVWKWSRYYYNILHYYISKGGHLWTSCKGDRIGGLASSLEWDDVIFPRFLGSGYRDYLPYMDYCVTIVDKVVGAFQRDEAMPMRLERYDQMSHMVLASNEYTRDHVGLPFRIELWEDATQPGSFFDPAVRGFTYVELYDTRYWMEHTGVLSQPCMTPMYIMKALDGRSPVNFQTCAFWATKYDTVLAESRGAVAAPSVHFGVPLWYFDRKHMQALANGIFEVWGISRYE